MQPTEEGIGIAAYARWERRGRPHGADRGDWFAAERIDRFARNYRVIAADRLDADASRAIGSPSRRRCRFCDQAESRATFGSAIPIFPSDFGRGSPVAFDQCDECVRSFKQGIDAAFARFYRPYVSPGAANGATSPGIAADSFKGLIKLGLAVMPTNDLESHQETIEWIGNPDHDFDLRVFLGLSCAVHVVPNAFPASWAALARLTDLDEAWPAMLFFLGLGHVIFQVAIPLGQEDDEREVPIGTVPDVFPPSPFGPDHDPVARVLLPIIACEMAMTSA